MQTVGIVCFSSSDGSVDGGDPTVGDGGSVDLRTTKMKRATSSMMVVLTDLVTNGLIAGVPVM